MSAADTAAATADGQQTQSHGVFKSGHLSVSSRSRGWKSWKRRWFLLTRTSLIFFKHEPRGAIDVSLALGCIHLNSSGRCGVKNDKKLLSVSFPDGRSYTFKADTSEEMDEWKLAMDAALSAAPAAALMLGLPHDALLLRPDALEGRGGHGGLGSSGAGQDDHVAGHESPAHGTAPGVRDRRSLKSLVVGRPILLALEDIDGSPSFLEKALRAIEAHGLTMEGILRASADVELVEKRLKDYEEGKHDFDDNENPHVVGDCIKHILRELPSSPVPPSCCTALLQAFRSEEGIARLEAVQEAISDSLPLPNRRLVRRLLQMMKKVAEHAEENRMSVLAVAACMAPLLFRPLFNGECQIVDAATAAASGAGGGFGEDMSAVQIMAATQAANQAQSITVYLMENFSPLFEHDDDEHYPRPVMGTGWGAGALAMCRDLYMVEDDEEEDMDVEDAADLEDDDVSGRAGGMQEVEDKAEDEEAEVLTLEAARQDLRTSLTREMRANEMLRESLAARKRLLAEERRNLELDVQHMREALQAQREAHSKLQTGLKGSAFQRGQLDWEIKSELKEIERMEKDVAVLRVDVESLQRQLAHVQHKQQQLHRSNTLTSATAAAAAAASAKATSPGADRRQRIETLLTIKALLEGELESTMAMCLEEQRRNAELEERMKQEDPEALEAAVQQQRTSLAQTQSALEAEMARGKELRRKMQLAQQRAHAAASTTSCSSSPHPGSPAAAAAAAAAAAGVQLPPMPLPASGSAGSSSNGATMGSVAATVGTAVAVVRSVAGHQQNAKAGGLGPDLGLQTTGGGRSDWKEVGANREGVQQAAAAGALRGNGGASSSIAAGVGEDVLHGVEAAVGDQTSQSGGTSGNDLGRGLTVPARLGSDAKMSAQQQQQQQQQRHEHWQQHREDVSEDETEAGMDSDSDDGGGGGHSSREHDQRHQPVSKQGQQQRSQQQRQPPQQHEEQAGPVDGSMALNDLSARLEQFKRQRAVLMQRLSAISAENSFSAATSLAAGGPAGLASGPPGLPLGAAGSGLTGEPGGTAAAAGDGPGAGAGAGGGGSGGGGGGGGSGSGSVSLTERAATTIRSRSPLRAASQHLRVAQLASLAKGMPKSPSLS